VPGDYEYSIVLGGFGVGVDECPRCGEDLVLWAVSVPKCCLVLWHFESFAVLRGFNVWGFECSSVGRILCCALRVFYRVRRI
jgi:hypothetical protein